MSQVNDHPAPPPETQRHLANLVDLFSVKAILLMLQYANPYAVRCTCKEVAERVSSFNDTRLLWDWSCNADSGAAVPSYNLNLMKAGQRLVTALVKKQAITTSGDVQ